MAFGRIEQSKQKTLNGEVKPCPSERTIREDEAGKLAEYLRRNAVKSVAVCVHCCENETLDEVAMMLTLFLLCQTFHGMLCGMILCSERIVIWLSDMP